MNQSFVQLTNLYIHNEESYRAFFFYLDDFEVFVRKHMDSLAAKLNLPDHYAAAGKCLGEERTTIWRATKK